MDQGQGIILGLGEVEENLIHILGASTINSARFNFSLTHFMHFLKKRLPFFVVEFHSVILPRGDVMIKINKFLLERPGYC